MINFHFDEIDLKKWDCDIMKKEQVLLKYKDNKQLINAVEAIKKDSDFNQWFTDGTYWMICKYDQISIGFLEQVNSASWNGTPHKATINELIEKFT